MGRCCGNKPGKSTVQQGEIQATNKDRLLTWTVRLGTRHGPGVFVLNASLAFATASAMPRKVNAECCRYPTNCLYHRTLGFLGIPRIGETAAEAAFLASYALPSPYSLS